MKKVLLGFVFIFIGCIVLGIIGITWLQKDLEDVQSLNVPSIDMSVIEDGTYQGIYNKGRFSTTIEVEVQHHEILSITMIDDVTFVKTDVTEEMIAQIMTNNSIDIDHISGATATVNAYLMAIYNALSQGVNA